MSGSVSAEPVEPQLNGQQAPAQDVEMSETAQPPNEDLLQPHQQTNATPASPNGHASPAVHLNGTASAATAPLNAPLAAESQVQQSSPEQAVRYSSATEQQPLSAQHAPQPAAPVHGQAFPPTTPSHPRQSTPSTLLDKSLPASVPIPPANPAGSPTRVYINQKVTPALLEGMKYIAANEPEKPLTWLGEFLLKKAKELE